MVNDYNKFAKQRQEELLAGLKPSHRFVEKPMMQSMLCDLTGKKVLLLGCGTGEESKMLQAFGATDITGIDISSKSIEIAKESYPDVKFEIGDMHNLNFEAESFDFVYSSLTIHYSENPEKVYNSVYKILKKGGKFLFSVGHPMRWGFEEIMIDGIKCRILGCAQPDAENRVFGNYTTFSKHTFSTFAGHDKQTKDSEILSFYVGSPSFHFKLLRKTGFNILDFTESKCTKEAKDIDNNYYKKYSEIPQFTAFLAEK